MCFMIDLITSPVAFIKNTRFYKFEEILDESLLCPILKDFRIKLCLEYTYKNALTKLWAFSEKSHVGKIRNLWNEITQKNFFFFLQPSVILIFVKNMNPHLYILLLIGKSMT